MPLIMIKSDPRAREKPCLRCGYSLRKLLDAKHCPECGLSVWLSLNSNDTLDWSNPEWLKKLAAAAWALAAAQVVGFVAYLAWFIPWLLYDLTAAPGGPGGPFAPSAVPFQFYILAALLGGAYLVVYHLGLLILSTYEGRHPDRWQTYRWSCRAVAGVGFLTGLLLALHGLTVIPQLWAPFLVKATLIASGITTWAYLRKLAQRIPQSTLARLSGYLMFLPLLPLLPLLKFVPFFAMFAAFEIFRLLDYLPIVYLPFTVVLLVWFARLFRRSAAAAEHGWASETAGEVAAA